MAKYKKIKKHCLKCKQTIEISAPVVINGSVDKALRQQLINGTLFNVECPYCHAQYMEPFPVEYRNMDIGLELVFDSDEKKGLERCKELKSMFPDHKVRYYNDLMKFIEGIIILETPLNDKVILCIEESLLNDAKRRFNAKEIQFLASDILFDSINLEKELIAFFLKAPTPEPQWAYAPFNDYLVLTETEELKNQFDEEENSFVYDLKWAKKKQIKKQIEELQKA